jgi:hypothetical protein
MPTQECYEQRLWLMLEQQKVLDGTVTDDTMLLNGAEWPAMVAGRKATKHKQPMKKSKWFLAFAVGLLAATFTVRLLAADSSDVTLSGMMVCGKCKLHETEKCLNVLQVEKDGKTVNYYLTQNTVSKDFHANICKNDGEKVTVTGKVARHGGKEVITASKIEEVK